MLTDLSTKQPYFETETISIYHGDYADILPTFNNNVFDLIIADPPYGDTSLKWDKEPSVDWIVSSEPTLKSTASMWCFASMHLVVRGIGEFFVRNGWTFSQDLVWAKHNGSNFHNDRFRRVHEHILFFYRTSSKWTNIYKSTPYTSDAMKKTVRRKTRPPHMGYIDDSYYESNDGGPRLVPSVIPIHSCHGYAQHPTQKPVELLRYLIEYACPPDGYILDPTMGVGSTLIAAHRFGCHAIGIEINERYCEIAAKRLQQSITDRCDVFSKIGLT